MEITAQLVDITTLVVDAIVNAANVDLAPGGGVCGGIYGYPLQPATRIAVATVRAERAAPGSISEVVFACFSPDVLATYVSEGIAA